MKNLKFLATAVFCSLLLVSCLVDENDDKLDAMSNTPYTIGFLNKSATESYFADEGAVEKSYAVAVIGGQDGSNPTSDIVVNYTVNTEESTATEGQEFDFVNNTGTLTIPAGSDFAMLDLLVNTGNLSPDVPTKLVIDLTTASSTGDPAVVATVSDQLVVTFVGCKSQIAQQGQPALYKVEMTSARGNVTAEEEITWTGVNNFSTGSVGHWSSLPGCFCYSFEVICGEIFVPDQYLSDYYSNTVAGINDSGADGQVDPETLDFTITYTVMLGGSPVIYTAKYTRLSPLPN